jgi:hypothetical protein
VLKEAQQRLRAFQPRGCRIGLVTYDIPGWPSTSWKFGIRVDPTYWSWFWGGCYGL